MSVPPMELPDPVRVGRKTYRPIRVLDRGFVRLVDVMGDDTSIVQAARVSYGKGTKRVREDRGLINYLMRHFHTTPFEMVEFKFHCKMPIFVARQWVRHRTANINEYSGRYSVMKEEFYLPPLSKVGFQSKTNRQGREDAHAPRAFAERFRKILKESQEKTYAMYKGFVDENLSRELARIGLPLNLYTEWYWKIDLHNLMHFLWLRMDPHAQWEIREYATAMSRYVKEVTPLAWDAFEEYRLYGASFGRAEIKALNTLIEGKQLSGADIPNKMWLREFETKLGRALSLSDKAKAELEQKSRQFTDDGAFKAKKKHS